MVICLAIHKHIQICHGSEINKCPDRAASGLFTWIHCDGLEGQPLLAHSMTTNNHCALTTKHFGLSV